LPPAFGPIWRALDAADRASASRQALAAQFGVSTGTLQRILVDGDVPDLARSRNKRIVHSWVRILARLARQTGHDARRWIEAVGIVWDPTIASIVDRTLRTAPGRQPRGAPAVGVPPPPRAAPQAVPALGAIAAPWPDLVTAAIATPLGEPLTDTSASAASMTFLTRLATRTIGAVSPSSRVRCVPMLEHELVASLRTPSSGIDLGVGITVSVARRRSGLDLLAIPGWRAGGDAVSLAIGDAGGREPPVWSRLVAHVDPTTRLATDLEVLHDYLRGQCGIPTEHLLLHEAASVTELAAACRHAAEGLRSGRLVFVGRPATCAGVRAAWELEPDAAGWRIESVRDARQQVPRYGLGLGIPASRASWRPHLAAALEEELLGSCAADTARLYAEQLTATTRRAIALAMPGAPPAAAPPAVTPPSPGGWRLAAFDTGDDTFAGALVHETLRLLRESVVTLLATTGVPEEGAGLGPRASELAAEHARRLLPRRWHAELERRRGVSTVHASHHCHSCSVSLDDPAHRGAADRFCRFCADDAGRLRAHDDVRRLIAGWMQGWQAELGDDEALRRAGRFMDAMPAWSVN
jgi:hypothetical protein